MILITLRNLGAHNELSRCILCRKVLAGLGMDDRSHAATVCEVDELVPRQRFLVESHM